MATKNETSTFEMLFNEVHKPSVSYLEPDSDNPLAIGILNGKVYLSKDYVRSLGRIPSGFKVSITPLD